MTCDEARLLLGADPENASLELLTHLQSCTECQAYRQQMLALNTKIRRAFELDWSKMRKAAQTGSPPVSSELGPDTTTANRAEGGPTSGAMPTTGGTSAAGGAPTVSATPERPSAPVTGGTPQRVAPPTYTTAPKPTVGVTPVRTTPPTSASAPTPVGGITPPRDTPPASATAPTPTAGITPPRATPPTSASAPTPTAGVTPPRATPPTSATTQGDPDTPSTPAAVLTPTPLPPSTPPAEATRSASAPGTSSVTPLRRRGPPTVPKHSHPRLMAFAASLVAGLVAVLVLWLTGPPESLATEIVKHVEGEPNSWSKTGLVTGEQLRAVLRKSGHIKLAPGALPIAYASGCWFRGYFVPHLVVSTEDGPVTVMILAHENVSKPEPFDEDGFSGLLVPSSTGSVAVVSRAPMQLEKPASTVVKALEAAANQGNTSTALPSRL